MFIEAGVKPTFGANVVVVVVLPGAPTAVRLPAIVRWGNERGFGVQFLQLGARDTYAISEIVAWASRAVGLE
jgi:hypothetical protein